MAGGGRRVRFVTVWGPVLLVLAILASGVAAYHYDLGERWFGGRTTSRPPDPGADAADVPAPKGVAVPPPPTPAPAAVGVAAEDDGRMAPGKVERLWRPLLADSDLGPHVVAAVADLSTGDVVFKQGVSARPASTTKLLTGAAALHALGADHRFTTGVVLEGRGKKPRVVLVGGGDPYLASKPDAKDEPAYPERADLRTLARRTARALGDQGIGRVHVAYDKTLFTGPEASPRWERTYVTDGVVAPIQALWADEGRPADGSGRVADPALTAATYFANELRSAGIAVRGSLESRAASSGATPLAQVESPPVWQIVERMLTVSDNEAAEVLAHQVGLATVGKGSFSGGVEGVRQALAELGVTVSGDEWYDGSGLSRHNVLRPETLLDVLRVAASADHPELRAVLTGLPVAGFSGSLEYRFVDTAPASRGRVRAKTGTLRGTSSLAGIATDLDGTSVAFVLMVDRVPLRRTLAAQDALDAAAAALGRCRCTVGPGG
jgi:D-alanyl-D-alanine carboxypeptidase/D-alanyl-D-alanine-endopeptidase (penicillin-binding protein 4)